MTPLRPGKSIYIARLHTRVTFSPSPYTMFNPKKVRESSWYVKLLYKLLTRARVIVNCPDLKNETFYYDEVKQREITEYVSEGICNLLDHYKDIRKYAIIMGGADFHNLTNTLLLQDHMPLELSNVYQSKSDGYRMTYKGIPVHVVPHMSGVAFVPKVIIEEKK